VNLPKKCVWIAGESTECQEVRTACNDIESRGVCETQGAVIPMGEISPSLCLWLLADITNTEEEIGECVSGVCYVYMIYMICKHYIYM
jgi:hypothetical protein